MSREEALAIVNAMTDEQREAVVLFVQEAGAGTEDGTYELECELLGIEPEPPRPLKPPPKGTFERVMYDTATAYMLDSLEQRVRQAEMLNHLFSSAKNWKINYRVKCGSGDE